MVDTYTKGDKKEMERDMYAAIPFFNHFGYEKWENDLEEFFSHFVLTSEQKNHYTQMKLVRHAYWWWKDNHIDDQPYKIIFVVCILHTFFMQLRQTTMIVMLSPRPRADHSPISVLSS